MSGEEVVLRIFTGQPVTDGEMAKARECPHYTIMGIVARRGVVVVDTPQTAELLKSLIAWWPRGAGFSNDDTVLVKLFKAVPSFQDGFYNAAQDRGYKLPGEVIKWFRGRIIKDGSVTKITPLCPDYLAGAELFLCLGENPAVDMVEHVCSFAWTEENRWSKKLRYSVTGLVDIFDKLKPTALQMVSGCLGKIDAENVSEAVLQCKTTDDSVKAKAIRRLSPRNSDIVLRSRFVVPRDIFGVELLELLFKLSFLADGKEFIAGLPSKDEIKTRMVELLLTREDHAAECIEEACRYRDELARSIGRARQAKAPKGMAALSKAA